MKKFLIILAAAMFAAAAASPAISATDDELDVFPAEPVAQDVQKHKKNGKAVTAKKTVKAKKAVKHKRKAKPVRNHRHH
ncbi:MAG: hypothetical protein PHX38_04385 [Sulfuricella sp.]|nr:hypothetical protein [Sulfuricella sp.]